jgi:hypothetical protein
MIGFIILVSPFVLMPFVVIVERALQKRNKFNKIVKELR